MSATLTSAPPVASPKFAERIGRIEISATMAVTAAAAKLRESRISAVASRAASSALRMAQNSPVPKKRKIDIGVHPLAVSTSRFWSHLL